MLMLQFYLNLHYLYSLLRESYQSHLFMLRTRLASEDQIPISHKEKKLETEAKSSHLLS